MTTITKAPNAEKLRAGLARVEAHPEEWNQREWRCGSGGCYAYHALLADPENSNIRWLDPDDPDDDRLVPVPEDDPADIRCRDSERPYLYLADRARRVLGLDHFQADSLFHHSNTLDNLREIVAELTEGGAR